MKKHSTFTLSDGHRTLLAKITAKKTLDSGQTTSMSSTLETMIDAEAQKLGLQVQS